MPGAGMDLLGRTARPSSLVTGLGEHWKPPPSRVQGQAPAASAFFGMKKH